MILKSGGIQNLEFMFVPCHSVPHYLGEFYDETTFEACAEPEQTEDIPDYITQAEALHQSIEGLDARIATNEEVAERVSNIEGDYVSRDDALEGRIADLEGSVSQTTLDHS